MRGIISSLKNHDKGRYGFISGEDGEEYYFDQRSAQKGINVSDFSEGDSVQFASSASYYGRCARAIDLASVAINSQPSMNKSAIDNGAAVSADAKTSTILSDECEDDDGLVKFYKPGYARRLDVRRAMTEHLKPNSREDEIVKRLAEILYVSRIEHHAFHSARFPFCLVGVTRPFAQYMRGAYEFLVVFSHFDNQDWQANTLIVDREIRKRKEISDRRPLVNFYVLVSNASNLSKEIDKVRGSTTAAVIPFSFEEILSCADKQELLSLFLERFSRYLFENNMLGDTTVIDDDNLLFGDRGRIADAIVQRCVEGKFSGIFGLRRSGKTSVLHAVFRRLDRNEIKHIIVQSESIQSVDSWKTALFDIAKDIRIATAGVTKALGESEPDFEKRLGLQSSEDDYAKRATKCFVDDVHSYCNDYKPFVIAIDEVERIIFNTTSAQAWKNVEAFCGFWGALRDSGCVIIVSGVNSMINEMGVVSYQGEQDNNPMYERITCFEESTKTYLPSFTDAQTKEMINTLGGYSRISFSSVYTDINRAFGGQPYAIRQFCAFVFEQNRTQRKHGELFEVTLPTFQKSLFDFSSSVQGFELCKTMLERIKIFEEEYIMLKNMALSPEKYQVIRPSEVYLIDHLEKYGLIAYDRTTNCVSFCINIVKEYLRNCYEKDPKDMTNSERRHYVQDYVAECEKILKRYIRDYYSLHADESTGRKVLLAQDKHFVKPRSSNGVTYDPNSCDFRELFEHNKFEIMFSAIRKIIFFNWSTLGNRFTASGMQKQNFDRYMLALNAGRTDADHYDAEDRSSFPEKWEIPDSIMTDFCTAKQEMDKILSQL